MNVIVLREICGYLTLFRLFFIHDGWVGNVVIWNMTWCGHKVLNFFAGIHFHALLVSIVFNVKVVGNLLRVTHVLSRMCDWFLFLELRRGILLLHLELLSGYDLLILCIWSLSCTKINIMMLLATFALFYNLRFQFENISWLWCWWHRESCWLTSFLILLLVWIELSCFLETIDLKIILPLFRSSAIGNIRIIDLVNQMSYVLAVLFDVLDLLII